MNVEQYFSPDIVASGLLAALISVVLTLGREIVLSVRERRLVAGVLLIEVIQLAKAVERELARQCHARSLHFDADVIEYLEHNVEGAEFEYPMPSPDTVLYRSIADKLTVLPPRTAIDVASFYSLLSSALSTSKALTDHYKDRPESSSGSEEDQLEWEGYHKRSGALQVAQRRDWEAAGTCAIKAMHDLAAGTARSVRISTDNERKVIADKLGQIVSAA